MSQLLPTPSVSCEDLSFEWADGSPVIDHLDVAFGSGRIGLIGANGSGKSTLLRLVAGELTPTSGAITHAGDVAYLPQRLTLDVHRTVADLLGITARRNALHAITAGDATAHDFELIGEDWDVEQRATETLGRFEVLDADGPAVLDRPVGTLSGGEAVLVGVAGVLVRRASVSLLDEPTNNLDRRARALLHDAVAEWPGVLIVVSHDRELLERVDAIADLGNGAVRMFGGTFSEYEQQLAVERAAAERDVRYAEGVVARERRQKIEAQTKLDRRLRSAQTAEREKRVPKIIAHGRRSQAQVSAGKYRGTMSRKLDEARENLTAAQEALPDGNHIRVALPDTAVPAGRTVLRLQAAGAEFTVRGPERVALVGDNGSGKTSLLEAIVGARGAPHVGVEPVTVPVGYLRQRLDGLDPTRTVLDNVHSAAPAASTQQIRAGLARFLLRGAQVERTAGTMSGGERFRVSLACLLLADPAPQLLLLDEPTNNLDLRSVAELTEALSAYRGALIVASHDQPFLDELGINRTWTMRDSHIAEG